MNDSTDTIAPPRGKITAPGVYDVLSDAYHQDPCPEPSLSAGMINELLIAPAKCWENSRRLNPDWQEPEKPEKFSIGAVAHVMHLEPHLFDSRVAVIRGKTKDGKDSAGYASQDAKDQKAAAIAAGKTPILPEQMEKVLAARARFRGNSFVAEAFSNGRVEQSLFWQHPEHGFWCRARPDFIADTCDHMNDYKATANANPENFGRHAYNMGYHRRAAWYLEGAQLVFGRRPTHYWFCNQEVKPPYLVSVVELDWAALEAGKAENDLAASIFAECLRTGNWYGYRDREHLDADRAFRVPLPNYALYEIDARTGRSAGTRPIEIRKAGVPAEFDMEGIE